MKVIMFLAASLLAIGLVTRTGTASGQKDQEIRIPEKYESMKNKFWNDPRAIQAGERIYREKCSVCHGERGDGRGPVAATSPVKPADFTKKNMVATMGDGYWFWRVSKGGAFPPFNSIMPPFENVLSEEEIWQVISYEHSFSHSGLHVHEELQKANPQGHRHGKDQEDEEGEKTTY